MRRLMAVVFGVFFFCSSAFLLEIASSAEKAPTVAGASAAARVTRMRAAGVVTEISDTTLKIERKVKDKVELMEFVLEKPVAKIKAGDKVLVSYITKDNQNVAAKVTEDIPQKTVKKVKKAEDNKPSVPGLAAPAGK